MLIELNQFHHNFENSFGHINQIKHSLTYLQGLMSDLERKSIEPIALEFHGVSGVRNLQHYMQKGKWDEEVMHQQYLSLLVLLISSIDGMITIDESDFVKKGKESVGVDRQYCGRLGKTENFQAGIFLGYTSNRGYGLLDRQLYMPKVWFSDEYTERLDQCMVPEDINFMTKTEIASTLLKKNR